MSTGISGYSPSSSSIKDLAHNIFNLPDGEASSIFLNLCEGLKSAQSNIEKMVKLQESYESINLEIAQIQQVLSSEKFTSELSHLEAELNGETQKMAESSSLKAISLSERNHIASQLKSAKKTRKQTLKRRKGEKEKEIERYNSLIQISSRKIEELQRSFHALKLEQSLYESQLRQMEHRKHSLIDQMKALGAIIQDDLKIQADLRERLLEQSTGEEQEKTKELSPSDQAFLTLQKKVNGLSPTSSTAFQPSPN